MSIKSDAVKKWRINTKQRIVSSLGSKCQICGYDKCNAALECHHINPEEKELSLGTIMANPAKWSTIVEELRKCVLLCSNCHREIHAGETELSESFQKFDDSFEFKKIPEKQTYCPECGKPKKFANVTCSPACSGRRRGKVPWDTIDLKEMLDIHGSYVKVAEILGVSDVAVKKREKKLALTGR